MELVDMSPCEDWEAMPRLERGLPEDTTPHVLWHYYPPADPGYRPFESDRISILDWPTVSPDGTLWVTGPGRGQLSQLSRQGTLIQTYRIAPDDYRDAFIGPVVAAPDGSVLVGFWGTDLDGRVRLGSITHVVPVTPHPGEERVADWPGPTGLGFPFGLSMPDIAIGPGGMVYVGSQSEITATCRGQRVMWRLTQTSARPDELNPGVLMRVRPSGDLVASFYAQRMYVVAPDGTVSFEYDPDVPRSWLQFMGPTSSTARTIVLYDPAVDPPTRLMIYRNEIGVEIAHTSTLTPADDLWYVETEPRQPVRLFRRSPPEYAERTEFPWSQPLSYPLWLPDGGRFLLSQEPDDEAPIRRLKRLSRVSRDGDVEWDISVVDPDIAIEPMNFTEANWAMDDSGVVYMRAFFRSDTSWALLAVQTDSLPPSRDTCLSYPSSIHPGCNAQRDHWLRVE